MSLFYFRYLFVLVILYNYTFGLSQLPSCQCECCPGEQCRSQLLIFSIDKCNETTCSFEQCYKMYPNKCGLLPGITNTSCTGINNTTTQSSNDVTPTLSNATSSVVILPIVIIMNILFYVLLKLF
jgi:hypothetical protein